MMLARASLPTCQDGKVRGHKADYSYAVPLLVDVDDAPDAPEELVDDAVESVAALPVEAPCC